MTLEQAKELQRIYKGSEGKPLYIFYNDFLETYLTADIDIRNKHIALVKFNEDGTEKRIYK